MRDKLRRSGLRIIAIVVLTLAVGAGVVYLSGLASAEATERKDEEQQEQAEKTAIPVEVLSLERGSVSSYISATANLVPESEVTILAETAGRVVGVVADEGDRIANGQVLALVAREEADMALAKARLKASNATVAFERAKGTLRQGLISQEEYDRLSMEYEVARQDVAESEWLLARTTIKAPFAGRVIERIVQPGQHVQPGEALFRVADFDPLIARIYLPETDVLELEEGRPVRITLAADASLSCDGKVRQISPVVDTATGTVKVTVEAHRPPAKVRPGAFVTIDIVRESKHDTVLLPRASVIRELGSTHVFVTDGEQAVKRAVSLGIEEGNMVEVLSGVTAGEQLIVAGQGALRPGSKVKIL